MGDFGKIWVDEEVRRNGNNHIMHLPPAGADADKLRFDNGCWVAYAVGNRGKDVGGSPFFDGQKSLHPCK